MNPEELTGTNEVQKSDTALREESILAFWRDQNIFHKSLELEAPLGDYVFYDGPPFATGLPHYGHLLAGTMKDVIPRYRTMRGYHVARKWGWDCHGLPIENLIEKELNLTSKKDIEEFGIEKFNEAARSSVLRYETEWKHYVPRSGRWVDMDDPYMSMQSNYMESIWWIFSEIHKKGLTKQGSKAMHLCPRCETTLANFEVNQGYQDVTDISVTAKFKVAGEDNVFFLAWTTTPWTLPGNVALAVGPDIDYVKVQHESSRYIVAQSRLENVFPNAGYEVIETIKGSALVGMSYVPVFDFYQKQNLDNNENGWKVYPAPFVTTEDGTGIVHIAPAFGSDDMELGAQFHLPWVQHVAKNGSFIDAFAETVDGASFQGMKVKAKGDWTSTDIEIIKRLAHNGALFDKQKLVHSYPHCWRCDTPLLNYAASSWFIDVPALRERLVAHNTKVHWVPDSVGEGRFGTWLEGARDWAISRSRFWGTPLPVWENESKTETFIAGSINELLERTKKSGNRYFGIRHGEAESNVSGTVNTDVKIPNPLTEKGNQQVREEAKKLQKGNIDYIFVSPLERTQATAKIIQEVLGLDQEQVITDERIRERIMGKSWENKLWTEVHGYEDDRQKNDFWNYRIAEDAETIAEMYQRVAEFLFEIDRQYTNKNILIVTHGSPLKSMEFMTKHFGNSSRAKDFYYGSLHQNAQIVPLDFKVFPHNDRYEIDLHRPYIDQLEVFGNSGERLHMLGDVFDVWFDSGSMPYAQTHYPFENKHDFLEKRFPAQFIAEGLDQTRGWFYVLSVLGTALFDKIPFENVIVNGLILAGDGKKMSKKLKNYPDPYELFNTVGADALRLYLMSSPVVKGEEIAFSEKTVRELASKVMGRMRNVVSLYQSFVDEPVHHDLRESENVLDQWIMARVREFHHEVTQGMEDYELDRASRPIMNFVDDFSTWYIRRSRDRFKSDDQQDQRNALETTRRVLYYFAQMVAPILPFLAEEIWQELRKHDENLEESVHLSNWPVISIIERDAEILASMDTTRNLVSLGLQLRAQAGIKVRQPLRSFQAKLGNLSHEYYELITDELNVKEIRDGDEVLDTELDPELVREGQLRDLIRHIQSLRKSAGKVPNDKITITIATSEKGKSLVNSFHDSLRSTTNTTEVRYVEELPDTELLDLGDITISVSIK